MRTGPGSSDDGMEPRQMVEIVRRYLQDCRHGQPDLEDYLGVPKEAAPISLLVALVKAEMNDRFSRGMEASVAAYLERFPRLTVHKDRVISLVYEEYCLREEAGDGPDVAEFCARYEPWKDSLASQLRCHLELSQLAGIAPRAPRYPKPGALFEKFRLRSVIGRGGSAQVYLAEQTDLGNRLVALKISVDRGSEPAILGRLVHDHIIPVLTSAVEPESKLRGLCMPYKRGLPLDRVIKEINPACAPASARVLREVLRNVAPVPGEESPANCGEGGGGHGWLGFPESGSYAEGVAWIGLELAQALAYAHEQKVLHLDVKPANVLLTGLDGPQLLDFNLSHDPHAATEAAAALRGGTLPYMAPEQLDAFLDKERWGAVGSRADLYSLGLLLREMLTGQAPPAHDTEIPLPRAIGQLLDGRREVRSDLRRINPKLPYALDAIVGKCIAFDPRDRYASAAHLAEDLQSFLQTKPLHHVRNPSARERTRNWFRRNGKTLVATAAVLLAIVGMGFAARVISGPRANGPLIEAITAFEKKRFADAARFLRPLADRPKSAVATFYLAASLVGMEKIEEGLPRLSKVLNAPADKKDIEDWGKTHSSLCRHADGLADALLILTRKHPDRSAELLSLAESVENVSLAIDGKRPAARKTLALIEEARDHIKEASDTMSRLIVDLGDPRTEEDRKNLLSYSMIRSRLQIKKVGELLKNCPQNDVASRLLDEAEACLRETVNDLKRIEPESVTSDNETLIIARFFQIEAEQKAGMIADRRKQPREAIERYREARGLVVKTFDEFPTDPNDPKFIAARDRLYFQKLRDDLEERIKNAELQVSESVANANSPNDRPSAH